MAFVQELRKLRPVQAAGRRRDARLGPGADRRSTRSSSIPQTINDTLGVLLKYQDDIAKIQGTEAAKLLAEVNMRLSTGPNG